MESPGGSPEDSLALPEILGTPEKFWGILATFWYSRGHLGCSGNTLELFGTPLATWGVSGTHGGLLVTPWVSLELFGIHQDSCSLFGNPKDSLRLLGSLWKP